MPSRNKTRLKTLALLTWLVLAPRAYGEQTSTALPWKGMANPLPKKGNYTFPSGFTFDAILEGAIFSYNLLTPAVALLDEDAVYLNEVIIPKGSRFIGVVQVAHSLDRINIDFSVCVFPNGQEIKIGAMALSPDGSAGVKGKVEKHKDVYAAAIAMRTIATGVQAGVAMAAPSVTNAMANSLTQETAQNLETPNLQQLESISVEERTPIRVFIRQRTEY